MARNLAPATLVLGLLLVMTGLTTFVAALADGPPRLDLTVKIVHTAFVVLLIPIYWYYYGPSNFLWFSDLALFLAVPALWLENPLLALLVVVLAARLVTAALDGRLLAPRVAVVCGVLAGVAALTRPDGAVYLLAHPLAVLVAAASEEPRACRRKTAASFRQANFDRCSPGTCCRT